jgi:flagellar P-ring protein FlgI
MPITTSRSSGISIRQPLKWRTLLPVSFGAAVPWPSTLARATLSKVEGWCVVFTFIAVFAPSGVSAQANPQATAAARIKDVASVQGEMSTPLVGYGLVVGLNKTGDKRQTVFSTQTLANMLERFGIAVTPGGIKVENIASVMVMAQLGPYSQAGAKLDVTASSIGDARSLQGGTLMPTPLRGPDGRVIALAQGPLSIGGFGASGGAGNSVQVNHLTVGRVPGGALVQESRPVPAGPTETIHLALHQPDYVSASHIANTLNKELGGSVATVIDAGAIAVQVPQEYKQSVPALLARIEPLPVDLDVTARVVINERTGTVVLGGDVRLGPAAVAHGKLSVRIATAFEVSQPNPLSPQGQTQVVPQTEVNVDESRAPMVNLEAGSTLTDVVRALNLLGATPRDIIAIMQALKAAGALRAELVIL